MKEECRDPVFGAKGVFIAKARSLLAFGRAVDIRYGDGWKDLSGSVSGRSLGKKRGKFTVIIYKDRGTDAIAVSRVSWKVE